MYFLLFFFKVRDVKQYCSVKLKILLSVILFLLLATALLGDVQLCSENLEVKKLVFVYATLSTKTNFSLERYCELFHLKIILCLVIKRKRS